MKISELQKLDKNKLRHVVLIRADKYVREDAEDALITWAFRQWRWRIPKPNRPVEWHQEMQDYGRYIALCFTWASEGRTWYGKLIRPIDLLRFRIKALWRTQEEIG